MMTRKLGEGEKTWPGSVNAGMSAPLKFDVRPEQQDLVEGIQMSVQEIIKQQEDAGWSGVDVLK